MRDAPTTLAAVALTLILTVAAGCGGEAEPGLPDGYVLLVQVQGDLDGDGREELVRLVGRGAADSLFREDLCLVVGKAAHLWPLPSAAGDGYGPTLELVDVTGDGGQEILVVADTGGSGGMVAAAVISGRPDTDGAWDLRNLYDSEAGLTPRLGGALTDGFKAQLEVTAPGLPRLDEQLDLAARREFYLQAGVYAEDGTLQRTVEIWGGGLMGLAALPASAGGPGLQLVQQARGAANADRLAEIHTILKWQENQWQATKVEIIPIR